MTRQTCLSHLWLTKDPSIYISLGNLLQAQGFSQPTTQNKDAAYNEQEDSLRTQQFTMVASTGVRDTITTLSDLHHRLGLTQAQRDNFFPEWTDSLPTLDPQEQSSIERIKQRYDYQRTDGLLLEGTINLIVTYPLLELLGFVDPPYRIQSPYGIALELQDPEETIKGFIDVLVLQEQLWILTVESKRTRISVPAAFPQLFAYMAANPDRQRPNYGMATNGDEFVFLKLSADGEYDTSRSFSLFPHHHELGTVAQILKALGQQILKP